MKTRHLFALPVILCACGWFQAHETQIEKAALEADQVSCIMLGAELDPAAQALLCHVAPEVIPVLVPVVGGLIEQRETAKKAGKPFSLRATPDAG